MRIYSIALAVSLGFVVNALGYEVRSLPRAERLVLGDTNIRRVQDIDDAAWVWMPGATMWGVATDVNAWDEGVPLRDAKSNFFRFRRQFHSAGAPLRFDVSADERFIVYLDGKPIARGPQRGLVGHWYYQSYEITGLTPGEHLLEAVCWQLGVHAPLAQLSYRGGFILKAEAPYDALLTTGRAEWEVTPLVNTIMTDCGTSGTFGVGSQCKVVGTSFANEIPLDAAWTKAVIVRNALKPNQYGGRLSGWVLFPADRPDQVYLKKTPGSFRASRDNQQAIDEFNRLLNGESITVPANTEITLAWDLGDYYCAYPELETSGGKGTIIDWGWAESMRGKSVGKNGRKPKGNRNEFAGKDLNETFCDTFVCDGRDVAFFTSPWWRCGRWCKLHICTVDFPLTIKRLAIGETHYPLVADGMFSCDDQEIDSILSISHRTMTSCMHEMLFDCPYYEQQMYPGDTRVQLQILNTLTRDSRMNRFAMSVFAIDQRSDGMVPMNAPTRGTQESATYTMCWIMMFRDYLMWHDDAAFLKARMPSVRRALMGLAAYENAEGFLSDLPGWSFMDWSADPNGTSWKGIAPCGDFGKGVSALNNLQYLLALQSAAVVDAALGEEGFASAWRQKAERLGKALMRTFWDANRGALADTVNKDCFSEHAQAMAIIADILSENDTQRAFNTLLTDQKLARASSYFAYYLFEAYAKCGRADLIMKRLDDWRRFIGWGAKTAFETQHCESRSDCHAWSASPIYFVHTAFAGVRPASPYFRKVRIAPQPVGLKHIRSKTPCPQGIIETNLDFDAKGGVSGLVILPTAMEGEFVWNGSTQPLAPGRNVIRK